MGQDKKAEAEGEGGPAEPEGRTEQVRRSLAMLRSRHGLGLLRELAPLCLHGQGGWGGLTYLSHQGHARAMGLPPERCQQCPQAR